MAPRRTSELLFGEAVTVYERKDGWAWGQAEDRFLCRLCRARTALGPSVAADARVIPPADAASVRAGCEIAAARSLAAECAGASGAARKAISSAVARWLCLSLAHLAPLAMPRGRFRCGGGAVSSACPMSGAARRLQGLDCSGLIQTALQAAGIACAARYRHDGAGAGPCDVRATRSSAAIWSSGKAMSA